MKLSLGVLVTNMFNRMLCLHWNALGKDLWVPASLKSR